MIEMYRKGVLLFLGGCLAVCLGQLSACSSDDDVSDNPFGNGTDNLDGGGNGGDDATDGEDNPNSDIDPDGDGIVHDMTDVGGNCSNVLPMTVRDFKPDHIDFEIPIIEDSWPSFVVRGWLSPTLGPEKKPVFSPENVQYYIPPAKQWIDWEFWSNQTKTDPTPQRFDEWYTDVAGVNQTFEKGIVLRDTGDGSSFFDSDRFFPVRNDEGFGADPALTSADGVNYNFLFTTEIHTRFEYKGGEVFTFRGDDDVWVFVNGRLALDLGSLHPPIEGTIDFDAEAENLGIEIGKSYDLDVFHAERHTEDSNFRIETTIECFVPVIE